jgi:hypothetical protein
VRLSMLVARECGPEVGYASLKIPGNCGLSALWTSAPAMNGMRKVARDWVRVLERLTARQDLRFLNVASLGGGPGPQASDPSDTRLVPRLLRRVASSAIGRLRAPPLGSRLCPAVSSASHAARGAMSISWVCGLSGGSTLDPNLVIVRGATSG